MQRAKSAKQLFLTVRLKQLLELQATVNVTRRLQSGTVFPLTKWVADDINSEAPLDPPIRASLPPTSSSMPIDYALADLKILAQCLAAGARLPDELMCRAFLNSRGYTGQERGKYGTNNKRVNAAARRNSVFSRDQDVQLVRWARDVARASKKSLLSLNPAKMSLSSSQAMTYGQLAGMGNDALRIRFAVIALFNRCVDPCPCLCVRERVCSYGRCW